MALDKRDMYRLPWSLNDNPIAWLEVTDICNLHCEGCYRQHITGHKTLEQVKEEVLLFKRWRNPDNVSIAGGEPLIYPHIVDLVAFIAQNRIKPIILTNGMALNAALLRELKRAGLAGFTLHVDSHQERPHWKGKTEADLNALRQEYADLIARETELYVVFNSTVYPSTLNEIPDVVRWGQANMDRVHGLVFITYRTATTGAHVARDAGDQVVDLGQLSYARESFEETFVTAPDVCRVITETCPVFQPAAYLGGTVRHDSFKWTISAVIGSKQGVFGSVGKQTMEFAQAGHHLFKGAYLAYLSETRFGRAVFFLSPWDKEVRQAAGRWMNSVLKRPASLFEPVHLQSIGIIQAPDLMPDGRADMCDSCPDITIHQGQFVNSCRMDEYRLFGGFLTVTERAAPTDQTQQP